MELYRVSILREEKDWRDEIIHYLQNPIGTKVPNKVKMVATQFCMQFCEFHIRDPEGLEALTLIAEIHQGLCGAHQNGLKMR